jgi:hypothetical protein
MKPYQDSQSDQSKTRAEVRDIDDTYIFNASSGLYEPKTYSSQNNKHGNPNAAKKRPMFLNINRDWATLIVSILALAVSIGTLALLGKTVYWAHKQWDQMKTTSDAAICANFNSQESILIARRQLIENERPWLRFRFGDATSGDSGTITAKIGKNAPIVLPSQFYNFGKTPARNIRVWVRLEVVSMGKDPALPDRNQALGMPEIGVRPPQGMHPIKILKDGQSAEESVIYPTFHSQFDVVRIKTIDSKHAEPLQLTDAEYDSIVRGDSYFAVWGQVWYDDIFNVTHWSKFCSMHATKGDPQSKKCTEYADVDGNTEAIGEPPLPKPPESANCPATAIP